MKNKIMFFLCANLFLFSGMLVIISAYLARVGFISGWSAVAIIALEFVGAVCAGYVTIHFEDVVSTNK